MTVKTNRRIVLSSRPTGLPAPEHFMRDDRMIEPLAEGQFLVRNLYLSADPAQRGWVNASANYSEPVPIGGVMRSLAVGLVALSTPALAVGATPPLNHVDHDLASREERLGGDHVFPEDLRKSVRAPLKPFLANSSVATASMSARARSASRATAGGASMVTIKVTNLWPNRLIGDKQPGAKRVAFASIDAYAASSPLLPSGLLGPVELFRVGMGAPSR
ncbi:MAG: NADP-dependent oxidoreductase [Gammaproteobacteria bacterium]|nr:NADP-dependent oxidoreductase [Gammaproteobacteria bacterium]